MVHLSCLYRRYIRTKIKRGGGSIITLLVGLLQANYGISFHYVYLGAWITDLCIIGAIVAYMFTKLLMKK